MRCPCRADSKGTTISRFWRSSWRRLPDIVSVIHHPSDHAEVGRIIADCDVLVAERLHALVIAATLGRASVALMYDVKVRELVEQLGLSDRAVDINRPFDPTALADMILDTMDNAVGEGGRLAHRAAGLRSEASDYFDDVRSWLRRPDRTGWPAATSSVLSEV